MFSLITILALLINAFIGGLLLIDPDLYQVCGGLFLLFSAVTLVLTVLYFDYSFLFQARIIFLATIGYFAGWVKFIDPDFAFSPVGINAQTFHVGVKMYGMTSIALLGAMLGLKLSKITQKQPYYHPNKELPWGNIFIISVLCVLYIGYLSARSYGPLIWNAAYASGQGEGQLLGNLQSMGVIFLVLSLIAARSLRNPVHIYISYFLVIYLLVWGILLRGGRLEFISGFIALFVGLYAEKGVIAKIKIKTYLMLIPPALFMELWGFLRSNWSEHETLSFFDGYKRMYDSGVVFAGTISGVCNTFANIIHMIDNHVVNFQYGMSYFEYILRTPPEFLYPDRPQDYSWFFGQYGYLAMGGFFELAEAYFSFGIAGIFLVPFAISYLMGYIYKKSLQGRVVYFFLLLGLLSVFPRGAWYQTFAYYKSLITGLLIFFMMSFITISSGDRRYSRNRLLTQTSDK